MRIDVFTIFPGLIKDFCGESLVGKAISEEIIDLRVHDIRSFCGDPRRSVDDTPFGGGPGMVMMPEPIFESIEKTDSPRPILLMSPGGRKFDQAFARRLAGGGEADGFSILCGRYEGVDQRVVDYLVDEEVSIGDFVLSGGEVAALAVVEAVTRLVPGVMGNAESANEESFSDGLLEYPQYTKPREYKGMTVPEVLLSGDHGAIARWRKLKSLVKTIENRPDLVEFRGGLSPTEMRLLADNGYSYEPYFTKEPPESS